MRAEGNGESGGAAAPPVPEVGDGVAPAEPAAGSRLLTPAVLGAVLVLAVSAATSVAWVLANGGVDLPPRAGAGAVAGATAAPTAAAPSPAAPVPGPGAGPSGGAPAASPAASAIPTAPSLVATFPPGTPQPSPTSDRYAVLTPCPGVPACYVYTVRRGDNLWSIARWFGVPLDTVYELNPELRTTSLRPGMSLILPPPTR